MQQFSQRDILFFIILFSEEVTLFTEGILKLSWDEKFLVIFNKFIRCEMSFLGRFIFDTNILTMLKKS